jgi:catalase
MPKITKRTLWGYAPDPVDGYIRDLQTQHETQIRELQAQLEDLTASNERLRAEIAGLQESIQNTADEQIASMLLQAHLEQTREVYEMYEEIKHLEVKQEEVLEVTHLHKESVVQQVLEKLKQLEINLQQQVKEGEHGGTSGL